jgi:hypothetical protein
LQDKLAQAGGAEEQKDFKLKAVLSVT